MDRIRHGGKSSCLQTRGLFQGHVGRDGAGAPAALLPGHPELSRPQCDAGERRRDCPLPFVGDGPQCLLGSGRVPGATGQFHRSYRHRAVRLHLQGRRRQEGSMKTGLRRRCRLDQTGSTLILALIFLAILSVGAAAILTVADTSIRATVAVQTQGANSYSADGAVQAAINNVRSAKDANGNLLGTNGSYTTPTGGNNCPTLNLTVDGVPPQA